MRGLSTDIRPVGASVYFLPTPLRSSLAFGDQVLTRLLCVRVRLAVRDGRGRRAEGWGETPLSAAWAWPADIGYDVREKAMCAFCLELARAWAGFDAWGHPLEVGADFLDHELPPRLDAFNGDRPADEAMPYLAALVCASAFDIALHDAFGRLHDVDIYRTYTADWMRRDLADFLEPEPDTAFDFTGQTPSDYLVKEPPTRLDAWHLVGGGDPLDPSELTGEEPDDGHPVLLRDWIRRDGLRCLKIKLRGTDPDRDIDRLVRVGRIARRENVRHLSADFNCTVRDASTVCGVLDRLASDRPKIFDMLLYVEQPFPYDIERCGIDVRPVARRKPIFLDESAHDWRHIRTGHRLGWTGVALKTCKTQTGALLSLCWARAHGMALMVQDLTNPMIATVPHARLAAHAGTIAGVEINACQFCPGASRAEARAHPGLYRRRGGTIDLSTIGGPGFGYRLEKIDRALPASAADEYRRNC